MIQNLYAIRDQLTGFKAPFIMQNDAVAERAFKNIVNDEKTDIYNDPKYFDLYKVGEFNDESGVLVSCTPAPELIVTGLAVSRKEIEVVSDKVRKNQSGK